MNEHKLIAVVINEKLESAREAAKEVIASFSKHDVDFVSIVEAQAEMLEIACAKKSEIDPDLILCFGGDGTILRSAQLFDFPTMPMLGINLGRLGFLSGATREDMFEAVRASLVGDVIIEPRNLVSVAVETQSEHKDYGLALNEVVIGRGFGEPTVTTSLEINGHDLYNSSGDGIIVATATGSTAYALSAGGPIMSPDYDGLVIVTLASHTLVQRAIVSANKDVVRIKLPDRARANIEMVLDGNQIQVDRDIEAITCKVSDKMLHLVKIKSRRFYETVAVEFFS